MMAKIERFEVRTLVSVKDIVESKGQLDLVPRTVKRRINLDYDYRRKIVRDSEGTISPFTVPHKDRAEMHRHRRAMEAIRKSGIEALPELVLWQIAFDEARRRLRGGRNLSMKMRHLRQQFSVAPDRHLVTPVC